MIVSNLTYQLSACDWLGSGLQRSEVRCNSCQPRNHQW